MFFLSSLTRISDVKKNSLAYLISFICLLGSSLAFANVTEIKNVRIWPAPENTRVVFDLNQSLNCEIKTLPQSNKVHLELKNATFNANISDLDFKDSRIKYIKTTRIHNTDLNIEIELTQSLKPSVFSLAPNQTYGHRLVIDLEIPTPIDKEERQDILALFEKDAMTPSNASSNISTKTPVNISKKNPIASSNPTNLPAPSPPKNLDKKTGPFIIAIDAGHGGEDPGAVGKRGTREKDVTLAIAKQLKYLIDKEPNMKAVLIRTGDYYVALHERVQRARRHRADLFISIHADAFHDRRAEGASVFTLSEKGATSAAARWLAARENRSDLIGGVKLKDKNKVLASVLLDLSQTKSKEEGCRAAQYVLRSLGKISVLHRGHVEQAGFAVLKAPDIPSLLVETGFISNLKGEAKLRNPQYQKQVAHAILNGIHHYARQRPH